MSESDLPRQELLRVIDANLNRAAEGLRVVEDVFRFELNDAHVSEKLKCLRHLLADCANSFDRAELIYSRESQADVGRDISVSSEMQRHDRSAVIAANMSRAAQSARVLEENAKRLNPKVASRFEQIRYQIYDLQKMAETISISNDRLEAIRICVLVECENSEEDFSRMIGELLAAKHPVMIQLRDKRAGDSVLLNRGRLLGKLLKDSDCIWIMNDRVDLARACNADGVHVGQDDFSVSDCRKILAPGKWVGVSTHDLAQVEKAINDGANYIGAGPMFPSSTKSFEEFPGIKFGIQVAAYSIPAFAIGGIQFFQSK